MKQCTLHTMRISSTSKEQLDEGGGGKVVFTTRRAGDAGCGGPGAARQGQSASTTCSHLPTADTQLCHDDALCGRSPAALRAFLVVAHQKPQQHDNTGDT